MNASYAAGRIAGVQLAVDKLWAEVARLNQYDLPGGNEIESVIYSLYDEIMAVILDG